MRSHDENDISDSHASAGDCNLKLGVLTDDDMGMGDEAGVSVGGANEHERQATTDVIAFHIKEPYVGMEFKTVGDAFAFYTMYGKFVGFNTRRSTSAKSQTDGTIISKNFVCSKEGFRQKRPPQKDDLSDMDRTETRTGCKACLVVKRRQYGAEVVWKVTRYDYEHNHCLLSPNENNFLHYGGAPKDTQLGGFQELGLSGGTPTEIFDICIEEINKKESAPFPQQQTLNFFNSERKRCLKGEDAKAVIKYCREMRCKNPGFFYAFEVDDEGKVDKFFWIDARSRTAYRYFCDIVSINTTYRTSRSESQFVIFTGSNHHKQTILFGAGLICDEKEDSYIWIFETWLEALFAQPPETIITDINPIVIKAIKRVFPSSNHHYCFNLIVSQVYEKLRHIISKNNDFKTEFNACCQESQTVLQFEERWNRLIEKYDDPLLQFLYSIRENWVPVYTRRTFTAGVTTSQWSETINAFFKGFIGKRPIPQDFVRAFDKALTNQYIQESEADYNTIYCPPALKGCIPMEKQVISLYTRDIFMIFQEELHLSVAYTWKEIGSSGTLKTYSVVGYKLNDEPQFVTFNDLDKVINCTCHKFEAEGILCRHALKIYIMNNVLELPQHCILIRWTRVAKSPLVGNQQTDVPKESCNKAQYDDLCRKALKCAEEGAAGVEIYRTTCLSLERCLEALVNAKKNISGGGESKIEDSIAIPDDVHGSSGNPMMDVAKRCALTLNMHRMLDKGKRLRSSYICSVCGSKDHNKRKCSQLKSTSLPESNCQTLK